MAYDELMGLVAAWKLELAKQVQASREGAKPDSDARGLGNKKADFLEGFYTALTCLERARHGKPVNE